MMKPKSLIQTFRIGILTCLMSAGLAGAQAFTQTDSGWVPIFDGADFNGLYSRLWGASQQVTSPPTAPFQIVYPGTDTACIRVTSTASSMGGNIGTIKTSYSYYRVRVQQKFDAINPTNNGGIEFHIDETAIRMQNNWPRGIEDQMQQQYAGAAYSIQQVTFTTRTTGGTGAGSIYSPTGTTTVNACEYGCNGRWYKANPTVSNADASGKPRWLRFETVVLGSDSAINMINDSVVLKYWNIRIFNDSTVTSPVSPNTASNKTPNGPWNHGAIGLQSEGALMDYRNWTVMEFPPATPSNEHFLHRFFLDAPTVGATVVAQSTYLIRWRNIGTIPMVHLDYNTGTGWQTIIDSTPNTGSYNWTVPNQPTTTLRVRVSGPAWAWPDSSSGNNTLAPVGTAIFVSNSSHPVSFTVTGQGIVFPDVRNFRAIQIQDVSGRLIRELPIRDQDLHWDLTNSQGARVRAGFYFVRLSGAGYARTARVLVF